MSFEKIFNKLCYSREPSILFEDFLDFTIDQFLINPNKHYFRNESYSDKEHVLFTELFKELVLAQQRELETHEWFDMIGHFYED